MRRIIIFLFAIFSLSRLALADTIYLKNGRQIECKSAWEEGSEVKYVISNGKIGIPKSMVAKIVKGNYKEEIVIPPSLEQGQTKTISPAEIANLEKQTELDEKTKMRLSDLYTSMAFTKIEHKDITGALEYYLKAYGMQHNAATTLHLAVTYFLLKDDWNAELYFNDLLKIDTINTDALDYLGEIAWRNEKLADAQNYWQKSLEIHPDPDIKAKLQSLQKEKNVSESYENTPSRHFLIKYDGGTVDGILVRQISDFLEDTYRQFGTQFETYPTSPFIVVLYPRQQFFRVTDLPFWAGGVNDGKIKLPVKGLNSINTELQEVLTHELAHSFIRVKTSNNCPVWLQEGLAQYSEGKRTGEDDLKVLKKLIAENQLPSIKAMEGSFTGANSIQAAVLYLESRAFTQYLLDRYQFYQMNSLLEDYGKGSNSEEAFQNTYLVSLEDLESQWRNDLGNE